MTNRKKKSSNAEGNGVASPQSPAPIPPAPAPASSPSPTAKAINGKPKVQEQQPTALTISRNKHWRYISAFHGPWLHLPHEILETLAHTNYLSLRPRQTDPGVLFDLLKIRKLMDEASDLAVRAQNGTASSALANSDNGLPGSALGLSCRGAGGNAKLSSERKYRMREQATLKLSQAYRLDEIAASVATMQSASTLDSVASLVLQRNPGNIDAKYVHFFHEKIPSRMIAEYTPLTSLNEVIAFEPGHAAPFRTRALTKIFKEDYLGAIQDLSEALALCGMEKEKHKANKKQLVTLKVAREEAERRRVWTRDWMQDNKVPDDDQPKGLEMQLLFQRGNQYLTVACQHIRITLEHFRTAQRLQMKSNGTNNSHMPDDPPVKTSEDMEAYRRALEAREMVRKYAKRALRDYTTFFSQLDYAHAPADEANEAVFSREASTDEVANPRHQPEERRSESGWQSTALVKHAAPTGHRDNSTHRKDQDISTPAAPTIHEIAALLSTSPPTDLPPFPPLIPSAINFRNSPSNQLQPPQHIEMITYHPLMLETLHSLLLTHCLLQTPPTALLRHANNVARLTRLADGYPFFLSARSPARADWSEIVRKTGNWISLSSSWESLCKTPPTSGTNPASSSSTSSSMQSQGSNGKDLVVAKKTGSIAQKRVNRETQEQRRNRIHKEAVMEALGDERVVDDDTFQRAVEARERRAWRDIEVDEASPPVGSVPQAAVLKDELNMNGDKKDKDSTISIADEGNGNHKHTNGTTSGEKTNSAVLTSEAKPRVKNSLLQMAKDEEYLIGTERAEAIAKWVLDAPLVVDAAAAGFRPKRKKKVVRRKETGASIIELVDRVEGLEVETHKA